MLHFVAFSIACWLEQLRLICSSHGCNDGMVYQSMIVHHVCRVNIGVRPAYIAKECLGSGVGLSVCVLIYMLPWQLLRGSFSLILVTPPGRMNTAASQLLPQQLQALLNAPAGAPPAGVIPNFSDPANLNGPIIVTLVLCLVFATLAVLMRVYTKCFLIRSWDYEDCNLTDSSSTIRTEADSF